MSAGDFARIAAYVTQVSGIKMPSTKAVMLAGRLRRRVRATGHDRLAAYCDWLFDDGNLAGEAEHLINAVTTNKTDFFREAAHFTYLTDTILPALVETGQRRLRAWSAACSSGAEPYTLAMLLDAFARDRGGPEYELLATDLDTEMLEVARRGVFPAAAIDPVPAMLQQRYVMRAAAAGRAEVRMAPALRAAIGFARLNLMDERYHVGAPMDLIFCRNVLIYFDRPTQERVVRRLIACLRPGGHLFLGHSESIAGLDLPVTAVATTVFRRD
ncbi:CheR family methyltransferase [Sphingomonas yunnanensis]|uniref:CheR family methyltransferase n=1 Tax=Sphingomonas yunnanensis TaxID=310400 RepID=UPI001FEB4A38|nr:protein-glutamate O-methyltransferase CheR [Sphingomonas yunnanensis]